MRSRLLILPLAAGLLALAGCDFEDFAGGSSDRYTEDFHYSYPLKPGGHITLENFNGSVEISGWDQNTVDVSGTKYAATVALRDAIKIEIQPSADSVYIRTIRPFERRGNMGARYVLKVPRQVQLDRITSSNGPIRVNDVDGGARLKTSNGGIRVANLKGSLDGATSNGSIEAQNIDGSATLKTSNGRVHADAVRGALDAATSNGGINVQLAKADSGRPIRLETSNASIELALDAFNQNDIHASTSNGGITLRLPDSLNAQLRANTSNSSISTDFEVRTHGAMAKHHLEGTIGAGGPLLDLSTSNGGIKLLKM